MPIYLDNAATSWPKPACVYEAINHYMQTNGASPGRGNYRRAMQADDLVYQTRKSICKLLGAKRPRQIILTSNATEALNMALKGFLKSGDHVLTTAYEHNAMWRPLKMLELDRGIQIECIPCSPMGVIDLQWMRERLQKGDIRLVAVAHGSNVIGCITPLAELIPLAHRFGAAVLVDAAQTAGIYPLNVASLKVDMLAFTGHKGLLGPPGTGGLYLDDQITLHTFKEGGTGGMSSSPYQPDDPPDRYEAGTMNICGIAGLHAAVNFLMQTGVETVRLHETKLLSLLLEKLQAIPSITLYGPRQAEDRLGLLAFNLAGKDPYHVAQCLDEQYEIMLRAGIHCAPQAHTLLATETSGSVRMSVSYFTTPQDIQTLADALQQIAAQE